jgi:hypothetical protein
MIEAKILAATMPAGVQTVALVTFQIEAPIYVWTELLTHKRLARNASSARYESPKRHNEHGFYTPQIWYERTERGRVGDPLPYDVTQQLSELWTVAHRYLADMQVTMQTLVKNRGYAGIANEQINRLTTTAKMVRGVVTATWPAWRAFLELRASDEADVAMQELAFEIDAQLDVAEFNGGIHHVPFGEATHDVERLMQAAARIARVSNGAPGPGQRGDADLARDLLRDGHLSPFEHIATWGPDPITSALCSADSDRVIGHDYVYGWTNLRARIEKNLVNLPA